MTEPKNPYGYTEGNSDVPQTPEGGHNSPYNVPPQNAYAPPVQPQGYYQQNPYAAPIPAPVSGAVEVLATDPKALNLSYWAIGLTCLSTFFGFLGLFLLGLPFLLIIATGIAGMVVAHKSKKIQPSYLASIAFWVSLVELIMVLLFLAFIVFVLLVSAIG
ncbi:MAG: hypothetical protein H9W81_12745 [Enterococcus sp.]|nr:hypothetical protein [Enterococcus sp.]